jgi:hypothetical protein
MIDEERVEGRMTEEEKGERRDGGREKEER